MPAHATLLPSLEQAASHMPFDQFGRYHMLREAVDACRTVLGQDRLRILDVGGFYDDHGTPTLPLTKFLPNDDLIVLDVLESDLPGYVRGDGTALHFNDNSFDLLVSADTFEHIPGPQREQFWHELLRVARHGVILLAPFATPEVNAAERLLFEYIKVELHAEHGPLSEHLLYGLPELDRWLLFLAGEGVAARAYPTGYIHAWLAMMLLKHMLMRIDPGLTTQHLIDSYYNVCFFPTERRNPAYRQLIIAEKTPGLLDAVDAVITPTLMPDLPDASAAWGQALAPTLLTVLQRQLGTLGDQVQRVQAPSDQTQGYHEQVRMLEHTLSSQVINNTHLQAQLAQKEAELAQLHQHLAQMTAQHAAAQHDVVERARWQEERAVALQHQLDAVQRGRVMRLLNRFGRGKRS